MSFVLAAYEKEAFVNTTGRNTSKYTRTKWTEEDVERLMEIYWEMKALCDKNDWVYVSKKLDGRFTKQSCRCKVMSVLQLNDKKYMKKSAF